ncbi:uncharacterized protein LOC113238479 [Hyposmocoma kahamanoa]|uniref:uncharacterized protein LOC113238479 n=1 Tax=Hyposmocoma kahamanoa TaxID=1477025 RepID=UPI000E6D9483|nr:uncharacterized protein LOC113238479 [Hyposmocoma kahamanoa]
MTEAVRESEIKNRDPSALLSQPRHSWSSVGNSPRASLLELTRAKCAGAAAARADARHALARLATCKYRRYFTRCSLVPDASTPDCNACRTVYASHAASFHPFTFAARLTDGSLAPKGTSRLTCRRRRRRQAGSLSLRPASH